MKNILLYIAAFLLSGLNISASIAQETPRQAVPVPQVTDQWRFSVTPYLWLLNVNGQVDYRDNPILNSRIGTAELLSKLQFGAMAVAEVHKGSWGFAANLLYSRLQDQGTQMRGQVDLGSSTNMSLGIYNLAGTYTFYSSPQVYLDGMVGVRIFANSATTDVNVVGTPRGVSLSSNTTITNPIVGVKGRVRISDSDYFVPFYIDVGGGVDGTQVTTQGIIGIGKAYDWGDLSLNFNNVYYKTKAGSTTTSLDFYGAAVAVTFKF